MKIIMSPAKRMNVDPDTLECLGFPVFLEQTEEILKWLKARSYEELKALWSCNEGIARQNVERLKRMELRGGLTLRGNLTPAVLSYEGIAYQYMAPAVFEDAHLAYIQEHLRILSGFYGVLRPMDGVVPYRLEMQAKAAIGESKDLYELWGDRIYREVRDEDGVIINLASKEYSRCVEKYLTAQDTLITCIFAERVKGKLVQKSTYAKMARGEMVRFLAEGKVEDPREMKKFDRLGFVYREELSSDTEYVVDLARLLGWGEATISRYESKAIQDEAYDMMLRLIKDNPLKALEFLKKNSDKFAASKRIAIREKIVEKLDSYGKEFLTRQTFEGEYVGFDEPSDFNGYATLNIDKIETIISYLAEYMSNLYKVKLMKSLWYADALAFKRTGRAMTGLVYRHEAMGALPIGHYSLMNLENLNVKEEISYSFDSMLHVYPNEKEDYTILSGEEKAILDAVIGKFKYYKASEIVNYMHEEIAYKETSNGAIIPFSLAKEIRDFE